MHRFGLRKLVIGVQVLDALVHKIIIEPIGRKAITIIVEVEIEIVRIAETLLLKGILISAHAYRVRICSPDPVVIVFLLKFCVVRDPDYIFF